MYYVDSNGDTKYSETDSILIRGGDDTATDLAEIAARMGEGIYVPGLIAYTAGYTAMWQLDVDGQWVQIVGGDSDAEE